MTLGEVYRLGRHLLEESGNESPAFDADCLFRKAFGADRQHRILDSHKIADDAKARAYLDYAGQRAGGRPLQYILGEWPFLGLTLKVGEGVLIPREETELLVDTAAGSLKGMPHPVGIDLCSGTGAVALGLASLLPQAEVTAAELYDEAYSYLLENLKATGFANVTPMRLDVRDPQSAQRFNGLDFLVSNPPYVQERELPLLQPEVLHEPRTALTGGADGLCFYRAIAELWIPRLKPGGLAAVEIGESQAEPVTRLFQSAGITEVRVRRDFNGFDRVVFGIKAG